MNCTYCSKPIEVVSLPCKYEDWRAVPPGTAVQAEADEYSSLKVAHVACVETENKDILAREANAKASEDRVRACTHDFGGSVTQGAICILCGGKLDVRVIPQ